MLTRDHKWPLFFHANANTGLLQQVLCDQLNRGDQTAVPSAQSGDVNEPWDFLCLGDVCIGADISSGDMWLRLEGNVQQM